jgi:hypothetical protein
MRLNEAGRKFLKEADSESACAPGRCIVLGECETREQGRGIGMTDLLVLVGRQAAVSVQIGGERRGDTGARIRVVAAKQDMSRGRKCQEAREPGWSRESCVEVKRLHIRRQSLNRAVRINRLHQFGEPGRGVWEEATSVRKDYPDRPEACHVASRDQVHGSPRRIERIVRDWSRYSRQQWYLRF